jgi:inorganic triphosphatase YgiF
MEIEAKYAILGPLNAKKLTSLDLSPYQLYPDRVGHHRDVLLDTVDRTITSTGVTLRLRDAGNGHIMLTFKGPNAGSKSGVHEREEIEATLDSKPDSRLESSDHFDYCGWPEEISRRVGALAHGKQLMPLVRIYIHRRTWTVEHDGDLVAEMALDQGIINAGGRTARVHELEVELKDAGTREDLDELDRCLREQLPLQPQPRGKLQRGLALLDKRRTLDGHASLEAVGRHMIRRYTRWLHQSEPRVRSHGGVNSIHDMRVAIRRLRTALRVLEQAPVFDPRLLRQLRRGLRALARDLGSVRDLDILIGRVEEFVAPRPELARDLDALLHRLRTRRTRAYHRLLAHLEHGKSAHWLAALERFTRETGGQRSGRLLLVRHFAGSALWQHYETLLSYETVVVDAPPETLHQVRIACKRLRYALELFEGELGKGARPLMSQLVKVQDHLGALQDTIVAACIVAAQGEKHGQNRGSRSFAATLSAERDRLREAFPALWEEIKDPSFGEELAEVIAGL